MLTIEDLIEFEHPSDKIEKLSTTCCAVSAGSALPIVEIFQNTRLNLKNRRSVMIKGIAEEVKLNYIRQRTKKLEELYILPRQLKSIENFYSVIESLPLEIALHIDEYIEKYDFELDILIGGVDEYGPHIYLIGDPGTIDCYNSIGYQAIGVGDLHAILSFISYNYCSEMDLKSSLYIIYEAKKISEKAPGVGKETDMYYIDNKSLTKISDDTIIYLEEIYKKNKEDKTQQFQNIKERIDNIPL